jgi:hypothetical protein
VNSTLIGKKYVDLPRQALENVSSAQPLVRLELLDIDGYRTLSTFPATRSMAVRSWMISE